MDGKPILRRVKSARFVVFEGLDGSGQSTQVELLTGFLKKKGYQVLKTKEPTKDSKAGKKIEKILTKKEKISSQELQELFAKDRDWHQKNVIIPALKRNKIVVSDRYFFSSFAYGTAEGLDLNWLIKINDEFLLPDLTFILVVSPEVCLKRIQKRGTDRTLFEVKEKLKKVWQIYKILPSRFENVYTINGERSIKEVFKDIKSRISTNLPRISRIS